MIDCTHARMLLLMLRRDPQSMDLAERSAVRGHVDSCPGCMAWEMEEKREDAVLAKAMRDLAVPADLRGQIAARLKSVPSRRPLLRRSLVAACVLAVAGLVGWGMWPAPVQELDANDVATFVDFQMNSSPEEIRQWFDEMGYKMEPPPHFKYEHLAGYEVGMFAGKTKAPRLLFQATQLRQPVVASVYVLPKAKFRRRDDVPPVAHRSQRVEIIDTPDVPDFLYVVIYTGPSLEPLMVQPQ